jgi:hypothetical protein
MIDFIQLDPGFALVETTAPKDLAGRSLAEAHVRQRYFVSAAGRARRSTDS